MEILGPRHIFGTIKDRHFIFGTYTEHNNYWPQYDK